MQSRMVRTATGSPARKVSVAERAEACAHRQSGLRVKCWHAQKPHNDVNLIGTSLKQFGFKVIVIKDADYKVMDSALKRYVTEVCRAGRNTLSFFYYSGHGVAN